MAREGYAYTSDQLQCRSTVPMPIAMRKTLDDLGVRCKELGGKHIDKSVIVRALINALFEVEDRVDWKGVQGERDLEARFVRAFSRRR